MSTEIEKRKGTQFQKGQSGNPKGRPKGSKNKATLLKEAMQHKADLMLSREVPKVLKVVIDAAKEGDMQAAKMILDRAVPPAHQSSGYDPDKAQVQITIQNLTAADNEPSGVTINGETVNDAKG